MHTNAMIPAITSTVMKIAMARSSSRTNPGTSSEEVLTCRPMIMSDANTPITRATVHRQTCPHTVSGAGLMIGGDIVERSRAAAFCIKFNGW